jgi:hypothetical protein
VRGGGGDSDVKKSISLIVACSSVLIGGCFARWGAADRFREAVSCGMTVDEVRKLSQQYGAEFARSDGSLAFGDYRVKGGNSYFWLYFHEGRLKALREGQRSGLTNTSTFFKQNVCTKEKFVIATVHAPQEELVGATVTVDGKPVSKISRVTQTAEVELPVDSSHEVALVQNERRVLTKTVRVPDDPGNPTISMIQSSP